MNGWTYRPEYTKDADGNVVKGDPPSWTHESGASAVYDFRREQFQARTAKGSSAGAFSRLDHAMAAALGETFNNPLANLPPVCGYCLGAKYIDTSDPKHPVACGACGGSESRPSR